jgi:uncharacterized cupin superfamily protein
MSRADCIKHWKEIQRPDDRHYRDSQELLSIGSPFGRHFGFARLGIHHELVPPGRRTSWPHCESTEDEFVYVIEGTPDVWLDGNLVRLVAGDGVGFPAGTGLCHTFINNTDSDVRLLVVGDRDRDDDRLHYPVHPARNEQLGERHWDDWPPRPMAPHDGLPDRLRAAGGPF